MAVILIDNNFISVYIHVRITPVLLLHVQYVTLVTLSSSFVFLLLITINTICLNNYVFS